MDTKRTKAERFKERAKQIVPEHEELQNVDDSIDNYEAIDELVFGVSEYLGGMATVIIATLKWED